MTVSQFSVHQADIMDVIIYDHRMLQAVIAVVYTWSDFREPTSPISYPRMHFCDFESWVDKGDW